MITLRNILLLIIGVGAVAAVVYELTAAITNRWHTISESYWSYQHQQPVLAALIAMGLVILAGHLALRWWGPKRS